jgi:hypothetical protein
MNNSFINRVEAERAVLAAVNKLFKGNRQLAGLSKAALEDWRGRNGLEHDTQLKVIVILRELGDACQRLSDRSHETFAEMEPIVEQRIAAGMCALVARLGA